MSRYLLDTNVVLLALGKPDLLSSDLRDAVQDGPNSLSVIVYWEVVLKSMKGRLDVGDPRSWWPDALEQLNATALPVRADHIANLSQLPSIHQDPFDRLLIATAQVENLTLLTMDAEIQKYACGRLRVIH